MNKSEEFQKLAEQLDNKMLLASMIAIIIYLTNIYPDAEETIGQFADQLLSALSGTNEQTNQSTTN